MRIYPKFDFHINKIIYDIFKFAVESIDHGLHINAMHVHKIRATHFSKIFNIYDSENVYTVF